MLKRVTCLILSLVLLVSLVPAFAVQASAASNATSDAAITVLKKLEGFTAYCEQRQGAYGYVWYTGYGTKCTEEAPHYSDEAEHIHDGGFRCSYDYDKQAYVVKSVDFNMPSGKNSDTDKLNFLSSYYKDVYNDLMADDTLKNFVLTNWGSLVKKECPVALTQYSVCNHTIRENEADLALRAEVKKIDSAINSFASSKGISLTQNQHDALVLFSYDNGTGWTKGTDDLQNAVATGVTGQAFVDVMRNWKVANDDTRRDVESNMYLNSVYDVSAKLTVSNTSSSSNSDSTSLVDDNKVTVTVTNAYINVRSKPSIYGTPSGKVYYGDVLHIVRGTVCDATGYRWGEALDENLNSIGYIALKYTTYDSVLASYNAQGGDDTDSTDVIGRYKITANGYVNVRSGAGTKNPIISSLRTDVEVDLYEVEYVNGQAWGRTDTGWFSLAYAKKISLDSDKVNTNSYGYRNFVFTKRGTKTEFVPDSTVTAINAATFTTVTDVTIRAGANVGAARVNTLAAGTEFEVDEVVADKNTVWGFGDITIGDKKYEGWIDLSTQYVTRKGVTLDAEASDPDMYALVGEVVNCVEVNVRNKASVFGTVITTLPVGTVVEVYYGPEAGTAKTGWYSVAVPNSYGTESWIRGDHLSVRDGKQGDVTYGKFQTSPDGTQAATGQGMVANTYGGVNVRTAPGTANAKVTKLLPGTVVDILEVTPYGSTKWGRIEQGWVCMDYIAMMDYDDLDGSNTTITTSNQAVYEGYVNGNVTVYKEPDRSADPEVVRELSNGDAVTIHELVTVSEVTYNDGTTTHTTKTRWARVNDGYIPEPEQNITLDALYEQVYTVTGTDMLKVREWPSTKANREDMDLNKGDQVKITNLQIVEDQIWGMFEHDDLGADGAGWICLSYCTKGAIASSDQEAGDPAISTPSTPVTMSIGNTGKNTYSGKIIGSAQVQEVNVRKEPSSNSEKVTDLKKGTAVTITETTLVDGRSWGYCGSGWINLLYVDLTPVGITAIDAKVIAVDNTLVYESSETGAKVVGSYANRAVVHIYSEMNGMYETDMGWIAKGNCL